jgi:hypothetical protein
MTSHKEDFTLVNGLNRPKVSASVPILIQSRDRPHQRFQLQTPLWTEFRKKNSCTSFRWHRESRNRAIRSDCGAGGWLEGKGQNQFDRPRLSK